MFALLFLLFASARADTIAPAAVTQTPVAEQKVASATTTQDSPTTVIRNYTEELKKIVEIKDPQKRGVKDRTRETTISDKVRQFFDFEELARQSLGKNWNKQKPQDREKFSKVFIALVENSYLKRSRSLVSDYSVTYTNEIVTDDHASVTSKVAQKDANVDITYDLHKKSNRWMIYNITLDNVNLIRNYQSQFNQMIKKKGFKGLIRSMEDRLKSPEADV